MRRPALIDYFRDTAYMRRCTITRPWQGRRRRPWAAATVRRHESRFSAASTGASPYALRVSRAVPARRVTTRDLVCRRHDLERVAAAPQLTVAPVAYDPSYPEALRDLADA